MATGFYGVGQGLGRVGTLAVRRKGLEASVAGRGAWEEILVAPEDIRQAAEVVFGDLDAVQLLTADWSAEVADKVRVSGFGFDL